MRLATLEFLQQLLKGQSVPMTGEVFEQLLKGRQVPMTSPIAGTLRTVSDALEDLEAAIAEAQTPDAKPVG